MTDLRQHAIYKEMSDDDMICKEENTTVLLTGMLGSLEFYLEDVEHSPENTLKIVAAFQAIIDRVTTLVEEQQKDEP